MTLLLLIFLFISNKFSLVLELEKILFIIIFIESILLYTPNKLFIYLMRKIGYIIELILSLIKYSIIIIEYNIY